MIQFPETAQAEWDVAAGVVEAEHTLRQRIKRDTAVEQETERLRVRHEAKLAFDQEVSGEDTTLEMVTLTTYKNTPTMAPADAIEGVMKENGTCIVLGPSGSGKSTIALQMVNSLMTGEDFLGQSVKPIMGSTGIMSYDMDASMLLDWMSGFPNIDPSKVSVVNAFKRGNPLAVPAMRTQIVAAWQAINTEVVVIDSFSASFFGSDQNDAAMVMSHYRDLIKFALSEVGAKMLIVITHSTEGKPHAARGSSVHQDVADTIMSVEGTGLDPRKLTMQKYRQALGGPPMMAPVIVGPPDSVTHLVSIDTGEMTLAGLRLPASVVAEAFSEVPEPQAEPDVTGADEEDDDL